MYLLISLFIVSENYSLREGTLRFFAANSDMTIKNLRIKTQVKYIFDF